MWQHNVYYVCVTFRVVRYAGLQLFYMYTNMKQKVTRKFKSGVLHEKHVVATWKLGNNLSIRLNHLSILVHQKHWSQHSVLSSALNIVCFTRFSLLSWRWRQQVPPKCLYSSTIIYGLTSPKHITLTPNVVCTSNDKRIDLKGKWDIRQATIRVVP